MKFPGWLVKIVKIANVVRNSVEAEPYKPIYCFICNTRTSWLPGSRTQFQCENGHVFNVPDPHNPLPPQPKEKFDGEI